MKNTLIILAVLYSVTSAFAPPDLPAVKLREQRTEVRGQRPEEVTPVVQAPVAREPFGHKEWVIEFSWNYAVHQPGGIRKVLETSPKGGDFGATIGVQKFITRNLGLGVEAGVSDVNEIEDVDYANVIAVFRTPLDTLLPSFDLVKNIAPYALIGVGHGFHTGQQHALAGGGVEYRFTPMIGAFVESRYVFSDHARSETADTLFTRLGVRFAF